MREGLCLPLVLPFRKAWSTLEGCLRRRILEGISLTETTGVSVVVEMLLRCCQSVAVSVTLLEQWGCFGAVDTEQACSLMVPTAVDSVSLF